MKTFDDNFEEACRNLFENAEFAPSNNLWNKIQVGMKGDNLWEKTVRQLFDNAEITPSERVWQRIAITLHRPVIAPLWRWASAAAVALVLGSGIYYFAETKNLADSSNSEQNSQKKKAETPQDLSEEGNAFAEKSSIASIPSNSEKEVANTYIENTNPVAETAKTVSKEQHFVPITKSESLKANDNHQIVIAKADTRLIASPVGLTLLALPTEPSQNLSIIKPVRLGLLANPQEMTGSETKVQANYNYWVGVNIGLQDFKNNFQIAENLQGNPFLLQNEFSRTNMRSVLMDSVQVQDAYSLGFEFARKFGKIFVVSTGLQYQGSEYMANVLLRQYTPQALKPEQTFRDELRIKQSGWGVPVLVGADWQNKNGFGLLFMAGLQANFANSSQITNQFNLAKVEYDLGTYQKMNFAGLVRFGASYAITEHFNLGLEGSYRQTLQNIYSSSHLDSKPSWLGFSTNLRYRF